MEVRFRILNKILTGICTDVSGGSSSGSISRGHECFIGDIVVMSFSYLVVRVGISDTQFCLFFCDISHEFSSMPAQSDGFRVISQLCPKCQQKVQTQHRFCKECGAPLE
jgi:hypothetical protein